MTRQRQGVLFCLLSAAGFGAMSILAKLAYQEGVGVVTLLSARFALAALLFWLIMARRWQGLPQRPLAVSGLILGFVIYSAQAGLLFVALTRIDASLASLLSYAYPSLVTLAAITLGRERPNSRSLVALVLASTGVLLVLGAGGGGKVDGLGVFLALASAFVYATYILLSDRIVQKMSPLMLAALVSTGAAVMFVAIGLVTGELNFGFAAQAWFILAAIAVVSTVIAITLFFAGIARVGPSVASILSTLEPPITVLLAFLLLGERLTLWQIAGGMLVLSAVVVVQLRPRAAVQRVAPAE